MVEAEVVGLKVTSWPAAPSAVSVPRMYRWIHESAVTVTRGSILSVTPGSTVTFPTICHAGHDRSHRSSIVMWPVLSHGKIGPAARAVGRETKTATRRARRGGPAPPGGRPRGRGRGRP